MRVLKSAIATLSIFTLLASCIDDETGHRVFKTGNGDVQPAAGPYDPGELRTLLAGVPLDVAFGNEANFRTALEILGEDCPTANLRACLNMLQAQNNGLGSNRFNGMGGTPTHAMWDISENSLKGNGTFNGKPKDFKVTGQIRQKCLDANESPGYAFDVDAGTLSLCVRTVISKNNGNKEVAIEMMISATDVKYDTKNLSTPASVFPNAETATGIRVDWNTAATYKSKLYAIGKKITVEKVWVNTNYHNNPGNFEEVPKDKSKGKLKKYQALYDTDGDSCIDMMFQSNIPPATLANETKPPFYCLGRCDDPPIINTK